MKKLSGWTKSHRKPLFFTFLILLALLATAGLSYKTGQKNPSRAAKSKTPASQFSKDALKNLPKKPASNTTAITSPLTTSSGFFRFNGTVVAIGKNSISLKLTTGTILVLTTKTTTNYYDGKTKYELNNLTKNTAVMATGTIGPDGQFIASSLQKAVKK